MMTLFVERTAYIRRYSQIADFHLQTMPGLETMQSSLSNMQIIRVLSLQLPDVRLTVSSKLITFSTFHEQEYECASANLFSAAAMSDCSLSISLHKRLTVSPEYAPHFRLKSSTRSDTLRRSFANISAQSLPAFKPLTRFVRRKLMGRT